MTAADGDVLDGLYVASAAEELPLVTPVRIVPV